MSIPTWITRTGELGSWTEGAAVGNVTGTADGDTVGEMPFKVRLVDGICVGSAVGVSGRTTNGSAKVGTSDEEGKAVGSETGCREGFGAARDGSNVGVLLSPPPPLSSSWSGGGGLPPRPPPPPRPPGGGALSPGDGRGDGILVGRVDAVGAWVGARVAMIGL